MSRFVNIGGVNISKRWIAETADCKTILKKRLRVKRGSPRTDDAVIDRGALLAGIGLKVKRARKELGASMRLVAEDSGINHSFVSRIENGYDHTITTLYRMCAVLGVEPADILPSMKSVRFSK